MGHRDGQHSASQRKAPLQGAPARTPLPKSARSPRPMPRRPRPRNRPRQPSPKSLGRQAPRSHADRQQEARTHPVQPPQPQPQPQPHRHRPRSLAAPPPHQPPQQQQHPAPALPRPLSWPVRQLPAPTVMGWNQPPLPPTAWGRAARKTAQSARGSTYLHRKPPRLRPGRQAQWAQEYPAQALPVPGGRRPWAVKCLRDGLLHLHAQGDAQHGQP